jgi:RimJ/RimL family protein N-acetyltransferase
MKIRKSTMADIPAIFELYDAATAYQKTVNNKSWRGFERAMIEKEITENRHFVITENDEVACTFLSAFNNVTLWEDDGSDRCIYIHRVATNPNFRGRNYVQKIVDWTVQYAKDHQLSFVRLDTHSGNERLNAHYIKCGFTYKGICTIDWTEDLPAHYKDGPFSLFEIDLNFN